MRSIRGPFVLVARHGETDFHTVVDRAGILGSSRDELLAAVPSSCAGDRAGSPKTPEFDCSPAKL